MFPHKQVYIFDLHGTLVNYKAKECDQTITFLILKNENCQVDVPLFQYVTDYFLHLPYIEREHELLKLGIPLKEFKQYWRKDWVKEIRREYSFVYDDVVFLDKLDFAKKAISTSAPKNLAKIHLNMLYQKIRQNSIDLIVFGDDFKNRRKPYPYSLIYCVNFFNKGVHQTVYVGDSDIDRKASRNACIEFLYILRSDGQSSSNPDEYITSLSDLV